MAARAKKAVDKKKPAAKKKTAAKAVQSKVVQSGGYDHKAVESKWQEYWDKKELFKTPELPDKDKLYILDMFPYPSSEGLHVGHPEGYTATDILSRYWRMKGKAVLHPMGWDAFGLPAENYALKTGVHPKITTEKNINRFRNQIKSLGLSYDWSREINTTDPKYYKWTQWIFLQLFKKGLAYEAEVPINFCPSCRTGLANEEVIAGTCERCGTKVERRKLRQWLLKITAYADRLLEGLDKLDWPDSIKRLQTEWIGKKEGVKVLFPVRGTQDEIEVFTTRVDTIFGATFIVLSPQHKLINSIVTPAQVEAVKIYVEASLNRADLDRELAAAAPKTGVFTGAYAINPITGEEIPIWVSDYVLSGVGSGAIMGVPAHDVRDYAFAKAHDLPIKAVVFPEKENADDLSPHERAQEVELPYDGEGILVDSGSFTGMHSPEARKAIVDYLSRRGEGEWAVSYKLRDWIFSRQRYWGEPIPLVHCPTCGVVPMPEDELPVLLPEVEKYEPTGTGESPLAAIDTWVNTSCPKCHGSAKRETNTMPQWAGSCWYYLRFIDPHNNKEAWSKEKEKAWMPVDLYVGGAEHAVLHLLYARFWHKVLFDLGLVSTDEPFKSLRNQGMILGPDGQKMSKSRGNVINPDDIVKEFGADTLRVYEMFMGPFEDAKPWNTRSMIGINRFLRRIWDVSGEILKNSARKSPKDIEEDLQILINKVTRGIEDMRFNTAISFLMEFSHKLLEKKEQISKKILSTYIILLSPFAPHLSEEIWQLLGNKKSIQLAAWPEVKEVRAAEEINLPVQVNGRVRDVVKISVNAKREEAVSKALESEKVKKFVPESEKAKVVYVPGKILNFVLLEKK